jgi:hypothetical protein
VKLAISRLLLVTWIGVVVQAGASDIPSVTITAPRAPTATEVAGESVPRFIQSHSTRNVLTGQLARWKTGICPAVNGLDPEFNDFVAARVRSIAAEVGAPVGKEGQCKPNALIVFTLQPQQLLDEIARRYPYLLGFHYPHQTRRLATVNHAIQGWYFTSTVGCNGEEANDVGFSEAGSVPSGCLGSRLRTWRKTVFTVVFIVADLNKVVNQEIGTISDYLAILSLTQAQPPPSCGVLPSILDFLAQNCSRVEPASSVTAGDLAFLKGLYQADLEQPIELEESNIAVNMRRQFAHWK